MADTARMQALVQSDETFGTTMIAIAVEVLDENFFDWDPEALRLELEGLLRVKCSEIAFNRMMGAINVATSNAFYQSLPDFVRIVDALADGTPPHVLALPDAYDLAWGMTEALLLWPPDENDDEPFNQEIVDYIGAALDHEGFTTPPDILRLGLRADSENLLQKVQMEFAEDPVMTQAVMQTQRDKTTEIERNLQADLRLLFGQLKSIGSERFADLVPKVLKSLQDSNRDAASLELQPGAV